MGKHWSRLPGEAVGSLILEMVNVGLDKALCNVVSLEVGSPSYGNVGSRCPPENASKGGNYDWDGVHCRRCCVDPRCGAHVSRAKVLVSNWAVTLFLCEEHRAIQWMRI